ncbi:hypothetical protein J7L02_01340 [Candidatus Woesearchaeota archaeon]|nr:hypothetical protein [Candidatus Woesearchaeota archaeon]
MVVVKKTVEVKKDKLLRITAEIHKDKNQPLIQDVRITGDFFAHPETVIEELEARLKGIALQEQALRVVINNCLKNATIIGFSSQDLLDCLLKLKGS